MSKTDKTKWLLLIHQIPPKPDYFRVKIWRRLQRIGAVAIKQSVYVLPDNDQAYEDLHWIVKEIIQGKGTASLSKTVFLEGLSNIGIESLFQVARNAEFKKIVTDTRCLLKGVDEKSEISDASALKLKKELSRIQNRFAEISAIDFFKASGRMAADRIIKDCETLLRKTRQAPVSNAEPFKGISARTWVTRKGIYIDRVASAWLICRFIDQKCRFKFVEDPGYQPLADELCFDMFEGEYTHIGDRCTFEVLVRAFNLCSRPMNIMAEIVHDIDLKDNKYFRPETCGIQAVFSGMTKRLPDDQDRLEHGFMILDELFSSFKEGTDI